ncbi:MAG: pantetheine-phosphate adenylyltransferase [Acidobacteriota bacterium]|nr:pantetheine-phosphate adenylyltransferase [Acidobacteriota bacterium]
MTRPAICAVYPGSFDPVTLGHLDIVRRACRLYGGLTIAVLRNTRKKPAFSAEQRRAMFEAVITDEGLEGVEVVHFEGLLCDFARKIGARVVIRGLRAISDFEYELQMAQMNRRLAPGLETVFLTPGEEVSFISSGLVREIAQLGGDVSSLVHPRVAAELARRYVAEKG